MKKAIAYIGIVCMFDVRNKIQRIQNLCLKLNHHISRPTVLETGLTQSSALKLFRSGRELMLFQIMRNNEKAILSPGIEEAIKSFLENSDDVSSIVESLTYIFNSFLATDEFTNLTRLDRTNYSYDFHQVLDLMQTLKLSAQKSGYIISPDGITEGIAA